MKVLYKILLRMMVIVSTIAHAQEVRIESLSSDGILTWQCPSNTDCTVEWTSSLTSTWKRAWVDLINIHSTNSTISASVPMFYRVSCWTNGLFVPLPVERTFIYAVSNALGQTWTEQIYFAGIMTIPSMTNNYVLLSVTEHYEGPPPEGVGEDGIYPVRSTDKVVYNFLGVGVEDGVIWQDAPLGTTWTSDFVITSVETNEDVTVPAGTFTNCWKFKKIDVDGSPDMWWTEWVKPGFGLVKWMDYSLDNTNAIPVIYQLESWHD